MAGRAVQYIVIHCSATRPSMDVGAKEIDKWHRAQGWRMIGYHLVIRRDGSTETGRPLNEDHLLEPEEVGAHVEGYNSISVGVCMIGGVSEHDVNVPENNFTDDQWQTLPRVIAAYQKQFPGAKVVGHRDLNPNKACPSFNVAAWLNEEGL